MTFEMDDRRQVELDCISSIFPETQIDPLKCYSARIDLPVRPSGQVSVIFSAALCSSPTTATVIGEQNSIALESNTEICKLSYLPSLHVCITLPEGYPERLPPEISLSTEPKWLPGTKLNELKENAENLWHQSGGNEITFGILDYFQQAMENAFGYSEKDHILEVPEEMRIYLLDFDINERQASFNRKTFGCGICLEPKKGSSCHQMLGCKHVFCVQCLQDFYLNAINTGDIKSVRCLAPECFKRSKEELEDSTKQPEFKTLGPSELLQIPLNTDLVTRFVNLKYKLELESDKNTVYCPRKFCGGAARSTRHCKPLTINDQSILADQSVSDHQKPGESSINKDLLSVCEDCSFAFCNRCFQSWHGDFTLCVPKEAGELTEEDKASLDYLRWHTTACPTCAVPSQKSHGCNHMICFKCNTHFCYLCSDWLSPTNPYKHYNVISSSCYMRLWELEEGDDDNVGVEFRGGRRRIDQNDDVFIQHVENPVVTIRELERPVPEVAAVDTPSAPILPAIQREGPLILRINHIPRPAQTDIVQEVTTTPPKRLNRRPHNPGFRRQPPRRERFDNEANLQADRNRLPLAEEEAHQMWVQRFVELALNDEEDLLDWNSDDERDPAVWEIPPR